MDVSFVWIMKLFWIKDKDDNENKYSCTVGLTKLGELKWKQRGRAVKSKNSSEENFCQRLTVDERTIYISILFGSQEKD